MNQKPKPIQTAATITAEEFERRVLEQQRSSILYPLEVFCRKCGKGHLAAGYQPDRPGRCVRCNSPIAVYREHPNRLHPVRKPTPTDAQRTLAEYRNERKLAAILAAKAPTLLRPTSAIADSGKVRLGDGFISAEFPAR